MRRFPFALAVLAATALAGLRPAVAAPLITNLLPDAGFEARGWTLGSWENCEYKSEYVAEAPEGRVAISLNAIKPGKDNRISAIATSKPFAVSGGTDYLLSLWYRTATADSGAAVSFIAFKAPFATAQFKTPQTLYTTLSLPPSTSWRLWTTRLQVPEGSVEATLLPRVQSVGQAWFDDLCFLPADQVALRLAEGAGQVVKLPDVRRWEASLDLPAGLAAGVEFYTGAGGPPPSLPASRNLRVERALPPGQEAQLLLREQATRSLLAAVSLPPRPSSPSPSASRATAAVSTPRGGSAG